MKKISNETFQHERALYGEIGLRLENCNFCGAQDGESALKECRDIQVSDSYFDLRYPFWHDDRLTITNCEMTANCRAALWYSNCVEISGCKMHGIKAVRECSHVRVSDSEIISQEWGWKSSDISLENSTIESEYCLLMARDVKMSKVKMRGKYSFQYIQNGRFENSEFDTKDAWWHAKNVTIYNCVVKGEYLGWYSDGLTFRNCTIIGTQPLCYCKNLTLINCKMIDTDLCFEKSELNADIVGEVVSIKNPYAGTITLDAVGEIIKDDIEAKADIIIR